MLLYYISNLTETLGFIPKGDQFLLNRYCMCKLCGIWYIPLETAPFSGILARGHVAERKIL